MDRGPMGPEQAEQVLLDWWKSRSTLPLGCATMKSELFAQSNLEVEGQRFALQNPQLLRVALGPDVLAVKGAMVAFQGQVRFDHEKAGSVGKLLKKMVTSEDMPLMRVSGQGEVFFANEAGYVYLVELGGDGISVNGRNLLAFDAALQWDINRVKGAGMMAGGLFNTTVSGTGSVALCTRRTPRRPRLLPAADVRRRAGCVAWSANLVPHVVSSMNMKSMLRGGSGEAFQYAFHGPGFVVVQPSEWAPAPRASPAAAAAAARRPARRLRRVAPAAVRPAAPGRLGDPRLARLAQLGRPSGIQPQDRATGRSRERVPARLRATWRPRSVVHASATCVEPRAAGRSGSSEASPTCRAAVAAAGLPSRESTARAAPPAASVPR